MTTPAMRHPVVPMAVIVLVAVTVALVALSARVLQLSHRDLGPELELKSVAAGLSARDTIERALGYGIPLEGLIGMEPFLESYRAEAGLGYVAVTRGGDLLFAAGNGAAVFGTGQAGPGEDAVARILGWLDRLGFGLAAEAPAPGEAVTTRTRGHIDTALPLRRDGETVGLLHMGMPSAVIAGQLRENLLDIATVMLLSLLLAMELTMLVLAYSVTGPLSEVQSVLGRIAQGRFVETCRLSGTREVRRVQDAINAAVERLNALSARRGGPAGGFEFAGDGRLRTLREPRLVGVRLLAFLFVMAEEIARPFMPLFLGAQAATAPGALSPEMTAGVIMTAALFVLALAMPVSGVLVERVGPRRLFALGAAISAASLFQTGLAAGFWEVLALRCASSAGYVLCYIACQGYVVEATSESNRASGMGLFVGGIMMADLFGAAIGGIVAERLGFSATFFLAAGVALGAGVLVAVLMEPLPGRAALPRVRLGDMGALLVNRRFMVVALLGAVPTKLVMVGVLYYLAPLYLTGIELSQGDIGRVIMAYGFAAVLILPSVARLSDRQFGYRRAVVFGSVLACPVLLLVPVAEGFAMMFAAVALMGLGHAFTTSSVVPLVTQICGPEIARMGQGPVLGTLRLVERCGAATAPLVAAYLAGAAGYAMAIAAFGAFGVATALALAVLTRGMGPRP